MKKNTLRLALMLICASAVVYACKKDRSKSSTTQNNTGNTNNGNTGNDPAKWENSIGATSDVTVLLSELEKPLNTQSFTVPASGTVKLSFPDKFGVKVYLPIRKKNGDPVTGTV